jgi:hypothetical protein
MIQTSTSALAVTLLFTFAGAAHADCAPVLAAYAKADATKRFAMFDVDSLDAPPKGEPFMVSVGDFAYVPNIVKKGPLNYVKEGYTKSPSTFVGSEAASLKNREQKGAVRCEPLGERKIGAVQAVGYQIRRNDKGNQPDDTAIHMWVSRDTGLPIYHGMGSDGGLRWVYGAAVTVPDVAKAKP